MSTGLLPIMILAAGMSSQGPKSIALTAEVQTWRAQAVADDVSGFLTDRMQEAWSLAPAEGETDFTVNLRWPGPEQVRITIRQGDHQWVDRPLPVDDPSSARAMVWLLVRSTVERALIHSAPASRDVTPPIAARPAALAMAVAEAPGSDVEVALVNSDEDAAWLAEGASPAPTATVAEAKAAVPEVQSAPSSSQTRATPAQHGLRRLWSAPFAMGPGDAVEAALVMRAYADPSSGISWGPTMQARLLLNEHLVLGGELGYRDESKGPDVNVSHVPITVLGGFRFSEGLPLEIGATATVDARVVSANTTAGQSGAGQTHGGAVGVLLGAYVRGHYSLWDKDASELRLVGELGARFGVVRSAYVVGDQRQEDAVVAFSTGLGLEWRWR